MCAACGPLTNANVTVRAPGAFFWGEQVSFIVVVMLELLQLGSNGSHYDHQGTRMSNVSDGLEDLIHPGGGEGDDGEKASFFNWSFISVLVFVVAGTLGNILVCLAVWLERPLQNVTNWFLVSLAFADLIVSTIVMPFGATAAFLGIHGPRPSM